MDDKLEKAILDRVDKPGWVTTRGILLDPAGESAKEEHRRVEEAMKSLAKRGLVTLWRLNIKDQGVEVLAAAKPDLELDKDLERRGAAAVATRCELEE
jgi:hypothetical protein